MVTERLDYGDENYSQGYYGGPLDGEALIVAEDGRSSAPMLVTEYSARRQGRSVVHDTLDSDVAVVLNSARPRSGTMTLLYASENEAHDSVNLHSSAQLFWISVTGRHRLAMRYAVVGDVSIEVDRVTRDHWHVTIAWQEMP